MRLPPFIVCPRVHRLPAERKSGQVYCRRFAFWGHMERRHFAFTSGTLRFRDTWSSGFFRFRDPEKTPESNCGIFCLAPPEKRRPRDGEKTKPGNAFPDAVRKCRAPAMLKKHRKGKAAHDGYSVKKARLWAEETTGRTWGFLRRESRGGRAGERRCGPAGANAKIVQMLFEKGVENGRKPGRRRTRTRKESGQAKNPDRQRIREGKCHVGDFSENTAVFHTGMAERGNEEILWGFADRKNVRFFGDGKTEISVFENFDLKIQKRVDKYENLIYNNIRTKYQ